MFSRSSISLNLGMFVISAGRCSFSFEGFFFYGDAKHSDSTRLAVYRKCDVPSTNTVGCTGHCLQLMMLILSILRDKV